MIDINKLDSLPITNKHLFKINNCVEINDGFMPLNALIDCESFWNSDNFSYHQTFDDDSEYEGIGIKYEDTFESIGYYVDLIRKIK